MALIHQRRNTVAELVPFVVGLVVMLCIGWILFPRVLYVEKPQPMNFSHLKHGGQIDLTCDSCHSFRQDGSFKGIPDIATCVPCHENTNSQSPDEALLIADYIEKIARYLGVSTRANPSACTLPTHHMCSWQRSIAKRATVPSKKKT